jgi:cephalosporin-C deacetylase
LCDFPRGAAIASGGPYLEIAGFLATYREHHERVFNTLRYFDASVLVATASAPALFSAALMDQVCPPSTVYAAYNAYPAAKELVTYPFNDHEGGQFHQEAQQLRWLPRIMPVLPRSAARLAHEPPDLTNLNR